jgi:hypothetical protein
MGRKKMMFCMSIAWNSCHNMYKVSRKYGNMRKIKVSRKYGNMRKILYVQNYSQNLFSIFAHYHETFLMVPNTEHKESQACSTCLLKWTEIEYCKVMLWDMSVQKAEEDTV